MPRISLPGYSDPFPVAPSRAPAPGDPIDAGRLALRLAALAAALDDLPRQARRFARWRAALDVRASQNQESSAQAPKTSAQVRNRRARRVWPLRPGRPPGALKRPVHEIHEILNVVHGLAFWALQPPDTS